MERSCLSDWNEDNGHLQPPPPGGDSLLWPIREGSALKAYLFQASGI